MENTTYALAALDMDGTLLNSRHAISPYTRQVLSRAAAAGKVIALCTGRCLSELWDHLESLPGVGYAICENGGCLYDVAAGRVLCQQAIDDAAAERILNLAARQDVCVQCFISGQSYMQVADIEAFRRYGIHDYAGVFLQGSKFVGDVRRYWRREGDMEKINLYFTDQAEKAVFRRRLGEADLNLADSLGTGYELSPRQATKALGLAALCRHLALPVEQTMAVGDGGNDLELMRAAGFSVAMGNATGQVRAAADAVTRDCDHDGAALAVEKYLLGSAEM